MFDSNSYRYYSIAFSLFLGHYIYITENIASTDLILGAVLLAYTIILNLFLYIILLVQLITGLALIRKSKISLVVSCGVLLSYAGVMVFMNEKIHEIIYKWDHRCIVPEIKIDFLKTTFMIFSTYLSCSFGGKPMDVCYCTDLDFIVGYQFFSFYLSFIALPIFVIYVIKKIIKNRAEMKLSL